jgi:hypothetical protein
MKSFNTFIDENKERCLTFYDELSVSLFTVFLSDIKSIPTDSANITIPFESTYNEEGEKIKYLSVIIQQITSNSARIEKELEKDLRIVNYPEKIDENKVNVPHGKALKKNRDEWMISRAFCHCNKLHIILIVTLLKIIFVQLLF